MLDFLPDDIRKELSDEEFTGRKHYSRATYALGCHGPLCRKAERDRGRGRTEQRAKESGREYVPNMDIRMEDDVLLDLIIEWYNGLCEVA